MNAHASLARAGKPLRVLIADDEPVARQILREELELRPDIEVMGEADTGARTLAAIEAGRPDLVLLDLEMPQMGGFEVISRLRGGPYLPVIVVVTAYNQYAIRAFEEGAIDYLLKPVPDARLTRALERARELVDTRAEAAEALARLQEIAGGAQAATGGRPGPRRIVGRVGDEYFLLNANEVLAFQAEGELVWIVTARRRYLATQSLKAIERKLQGGSFRRVHRSALVNVDHVRKMAALSSNRWLMTLDNNQEFVVSKRLARNVREILSW
ncbi:MAG TPA: LytTR family DNA-binding domain-containing protein [Bryobacteraceae bacterium]|nr:LytTR family DNA-binding domain-containing protein [Bryobacteraceae bacterium]